MPKIKLVVRLQHWMDSVPGQTFLNYAYSWGASIVILGALFKLTYLPGGNLMLFIGMGTEVVVFFLSAFDRPFDKSEDGKELPRYYETDEEIAARLGLTDDEEAPTVASVAAASAPAQPAAPAAAQPAAAATAAPAMAQPVQQAPMAGGGTFINFGGAPAMSAPSASPAEQPAAAVAQPAAEPAAEADAAMATARATARKVAPDVDAQQLAGIIRLANDELLRRAQAVLSPDMEEATQTYIERLKNLTETLEKVDEQSTRLMRDSEEMENLGRTLTGINKIYELQLKGISSQVGTIDDINEQTRRLATQIEELNGVYSRMIRALTVNMKNAASAAEQ